MLRSVSDGAEHFLTSLYVHNAYAVQDLEIPISREGEGRRHLLITGPNGSGKSSILKAVHRELMSGPGSPTKTWLAAKANHQHIEGILESMPSRSEQRSSLEQTLVSASGNVKHSFAVGPLVEVRGLPPVMDATRTLLAFMPASRSLRLQRPAGPTRIDESKYLRAEGAASMLLQFLVNLRTEQAYAREDGDDAVADRIGKRFEEIEEHLRDILDDHRASLHFDRPSFGFQIILGDGRHVDFDTLPDGISNILFMWATLMIPAEALLRSGVSDPLGWVLIDEPELHLHARLQEMVLPFLTTMFPNLQFIVATHSPAVLASLPNATIFDLRSREAIDSADLQGVRYGTILTQHFGIETDFDLETTRKLKRLKEISVADPAPGTPDFEEMRAIVRDLADLPHLLIAQMSKKLELDVA